MDDLELKRVREEADVVFNAKLEILKSSRGKKNLNNLISTNNLGMSSGRSKKFNMSRLETDENDNDINAIDNKEKLQQLENECYKIMSKRNQLIKRRKAFLNRANLNKSQYN